MLDLSRLGRRRSAAGLMRLRTRWLLLFVAVAEAVGCRAPHYRASTMPQELRAPATTFHEMNLAGMSGLGVGSSLIGPGDLVEITIASGSEEGKLEPALARVDQNGYVNVPLIGQIAVAGMEPFEAAQRVEAASIELGLYRHPAVVFNVKEPAVNQVTVLGAVADPGVKQLPRSSSNVINAVAAAGGFTEKASTTVEVTHQRSPSFIATAGGSDGVVTAAYREPIFSTPPLALEPRVQGGSSPASPASYRLDLAQAERSGPSGYSVGDGDVVMVLPEKDRVIHVSGLVNKPDQFKIPKDQDVYVLDAIAMAGGTKSPIADKVYVIRRPPNMPEPVVIEVSIAQAKRDGKENIRLTAGDMVSVEATALTNTVDTLTTFFRLSLGLGGSFSFF